MLFYVPLILLIIMIMIIFRYNNNIFSYIMQKKIDSFLLNQHTAGFKFMKSQIVTRANEFLQSKHDVNFRCIQQLDFSYTFAKKLLLNPTVKSKTF